MDLFTTLIITLISLLIYYFCLLGFIQDRIKYYTGTFPPGPRGFPVVGSFFSIGHRPYLTFGSWVKHYGKIFLVKVFHLRVFIISDIKIAREAYNNPLLLGKPDTDILKVLSMGDYGVVASQGHDWNVQRRFMLQQLKNQGFGRQSMESLIMTEVEDMIEWLKSQEGKPLALNRQFAVAVLSSLWQIMSGCRLNQHDSRLQQLLDNNNQALNDVTNNSFGIFFPRLTEYFPKYTGWNDLLKAVGGLHRFLKDVVEEHRQHLVQNKNHHEEHEEPRDFIEAFLQEIQKTDDPQSSFYKEIGEKSLIATLGDLFTAGSDTTSGTLSWAILYISSDQDVQRKIHEEIDRVVGQSRNVTLEDRKNMPYLEAVILETLRKSALTSLGLFHTAIEDTTLSGYKIPKGSWICLNQHYIHHDPSIWPSPHHFIPDRFLQGNKFYNNAYRGSDKGQNKSGIGDLVAFSIGKRACVGQSLALDSLFLFLSNIYQQFHIQFDPASPKPSLEPRTKYFLATHAYKVILSPRV